LGERLCIADPARRCVRLRRPATDDQTDQAVL
jgi:hypothetical protein